MSLKVVHLVYSFGIGGLERVIVNLINNSKELDAEHHIVTLIDDHAFASHLEPKVCMHSLNKKDGKDLLCHFRLFKLLKKLNPDVVHTYNFGTIEYQAVAWLAGVPVRVHAEHGRESSYKKIDNPQKYERFRKLMIPFLNYFVVVSKDLQSWGQTRLGLTDKKLKLIFNGISLSEFSCNENIEQSKDFTFASVGRLVDVKNHELLINAFHRSMEIDSTLSQAKLVIVGDGPNMSALKQQINDLKLGSNVTLTGHCGDIPSILNRSNVFVLSSRYEAMPMTALEAMACRLPVIGPRVGGVEFILNNKVNGLLVEPNEVEKMASALVYAFQHKDELITMGINGRAMVESDFSVDAMCKNYIELYQM